MCALRIISGIEFNSQKNYKVTFSNIFINLLDFFFFFVMTTYTKKISTAEKFINYKTASHVITNLLGYYRKCFSSTKYYKIIEKMFVRLPWYC